MSERDAEQLRTPPRGRPVLRAVDVPSEPRPAEQSAPSDSTVADGSPAARFVEALAAAEAQAQAVTARVAHVQKELRRARAVLAEADRSRTTLPYTETLVRRGVLALLGGLLALAVWARTVDYSLRVISDTPTFLALVAGMAKEPFTEQSPFLDAGVATQHATPYVQALAFIWQALDGSSNSPVALGGFLALVGIAVFAFMLWCVFLYVRRLAGATAAWVSIPVLLGIFGPPHVIWASDLSLHAALYAGFFPQNLALGTALLTLLALERRSPVFLVVSCLLAALTMLVHPFTGVLLCVLATAQSCHLAVQGDRMAAARRPIALGAGFALGLLWPAYSLDRAFAETGLRGVLFVALCIAVPIAVYALGAARRGLPTAPGFLTRALAWLDSADAAFRLAIVGAVGTVAIVVWEWALVHSPPEESARLAIYWVDDRWRWPFLLIAGTVGISGLARLARRGQIVLPVWFAGCFALGVLGAAGLPLPVWYRFLLLCQLPLAVGVATVVAETRRVRTIAIVAATVALALTVKVVTLVATPPTVSYFGRSLQPVWSIGEHIPPGPGLVATDPATAYFVPSTTGRHVLTVDKGHVSSRQELDRARKGYALLRRFYAGGPGWWEAAQQMWRRGVRYVVVAKQTTLEPRTLDDFIWQNALLRTSAQRDALGNYFYENNRVGTLVYDSDDYVVYRLSREKLFPDEGATP